jgi:hypothetical protein
MKPIKDGDTGLIDKYLIFKIENQRFVEKLTWSFVLSPEKDDEYGRASRTAMKAYAKSVKNKNYLLYCDILNRVVNAEHNIKISRKQHGK